MPLVLPVLNGLLGTVALLATACGIVLRAMSRRAADATLGALLGGSAAPATLDPVQAAEGVIVDLRKVSVVLAGAFPG